MTLRLLTYNIQRGGRGRESALARVIAACSPDVVVLQEAQDPAVVERLARDCAMGQWGAQPQSSLGFLSRNLLTHYAWHRPRRSRHAFLELVLPDGMRVFGVHLAAVHSAWTERRRLTEFRALLAGIAEHQHGFHVLAGDFNTLAPGELLEIRQLPYRLRTLVWLSGGRIRWKTIEAVLAAGYVDGFRRLNHGTAGATFPTRAPHIRLDYVFVPERFAGRLRTCSVMTGEDAARASDHFPLFAEFGSADRQS
ncbi:MAG: endonuclease/exonuclease/phosphatase family protein [Acidobacteriota bacterium]